jgi:hypothetical protein
MNWPADTGPGPNVVVVVVVIVVVVVSPIAGSSAGKEDDTGGGSVVTTVSNGRSGIGLSMERTDRWRNRLGNTACTANKDFSARA